jgi:hypothetical protein
MSGFDENNWSMQCVFGLMKNPPRA